jgi:hypothetical protein
MQRSKMLKPAPIPRGVTFAFVALTFVGVLLSMHLRTELREANQALADARAATTLDVQISSVEGELTDYCLDYGQRLMARCDYWDRQSHAALQDCSLQLRLLSRKCE